MPPGVCELPSDEPLKPVAEAVHSVLAVLNGRESPVLAST
jgi:hypothetical protein